MSLEYDDQNRLVRRISWGPSGDWSDTMQLVYETGNRPVKVIFSSVDNGSTWRSEREIRYVDNLVIIGQSDTIIVDANQRMVGWNEFGNAVFHYNANGNLTNITWEEDGGSRVLTYSNVRSPFRYVNIPAWLMFWAFDLLYPSQGFMPASFAWGDDSGTMTTMTYTSDGNWVRTRTITWASEEDGSSTATFEYINAR